MEADFAVLTSHIACRESGVSETLSHSKLGAHDAEILMLVHSKATALASMQLELMATQAITAPGTAHLEARAVMSDEQRYE